MPVVLKLWIDFSKKRKHSRQFAVRTGNSIFVVLGMLLLHFISCILAVELFPTSVKIFSYTFVVYTVACNYLSTRVTKTCSAGQSKFRVYSLTSAFWHHSTNTWREAKSATRTGILSFLKIRILMNDKKSKEEFLSDIDCDFYNM